MEVSPYHEADLGLYFTGRPLELALYEGLFRAMDTAFPNGRVKIQKSQISFYGRHLFAAASLPVRRKKDWPEHCLLVTFGLEYPLSSPRIAVATEPYPNRWTHHVVVARPEDVDGELLGWLDTTPLITHTYPLEKIEEAYRLFESHADGVMKVAIACAGVP